VKRAISEHSLQQAKTSFRSSYPPLASPFCLPAQRHEKAQEKLQTSFSLCPRFGLELLPRNVCSSRASERETFKVSERKDDNRVGPMKKKMIGEKPGEEKKRSKINEWRLFNYFPQDHMILCFSLGLAAFFPPPCIRVELLALPLRVFHPRSPRKTSQGVILELINNPFLAACSRPKKNHSSLLPSSAARRVGCEHTNRYITTTNASSTPQRHRREAAGRRAPSTHTSGCS
jgi:hypothetical protein